MNECGKVARIYAFGKSRAGAKVSDEFGTFGLICGEFRSKFLLKPPRRTFQSAQKFHCQPSSSRISVCRSRFRFNFALIRTGNLLSIKKNEFCWSPIMCGVCVCWIVHCLIKISFIVDGEKKRVALSCLHSMDDDAFSAKNAAATKRAIELIERCFSLYPMCNCIERSEFRQPSFGLHGEKFSFFDCWKENFRADMPVFERKIFFFTRSLTNTWAKWFDSPPENFTAKDASGGA